MARITRVQRTVIGDRADPSAISGAAAPFQAAASALTAVAERQERLERASAEAEVTKANAEANRQFQAAYDNNRVAFQNNPTEGQEPFTNTLNTIKNSISEGLTSDRAKSLFESGITQMESSYTLKRDNWQTQQVASNTFKNLSEASNSYANQAELAGRGLDLDAFTSIVQTSSDAIVAASAALSPENANKLRENNNKSIVTGFILGGIQTEPSNVVSLINEGRFDEFLSPEEKVKFKRQAFTEEDKQERDAENELKIDQEATYSAMSISILTNEAPPSVQDVENLINIGRITPAQGERLVRSLTKPETTRGDIRTYTELNKKLVSGVLTEEEIFDAAADNLITRPQANQFVEYLTTEVARNPSVQRAFKELDAIYPEGQLGFRPPEDERAYSEAQVEILDGVRQGKIAADIVEDIRVTAEQEKAIRTQNLSRTKVVKDLGDNPDFSDYEDLEQEYFQKLQTATTGAQRERVRSLLQELQKLKRDNGFE